MVATVLASSGAGRSGTISTPVVRMMRSVTAAMAVSTVSGSSQGASEGNGKGAPLVAVVRLPISTWSEITTPSRPASSAWRPMSTSTRESPAPSPVPAGSDTEQPRLVPSMR